MTKSSRTGLLLLLVASIGLLAVVSLWSLTVGASALSLTDLFTALQTPLAEDRTAVILWQVRLPRVLAGLAAGAGLAVAGAIMQAVTANPLADPGLLGVNSGAAFAVVILVAITGGGTSQHMIWAAFAGAVITATVVYSLGSIGRSGATPLKLILAGVIVSSFLISITTSILLIDAQTLAEVRFWTIGSLRNRQLGDVAPLLPYLCVGLIATMITSAQFTSLSLGAEIAAGLGQNQALWRGISAILVVILAGTAVSIAGPLAFVGLVVPHIVRLSIGADYRWILPFCATVGAGLVVVADTLPRAIWARDIPVGITMAIIGAPFFIWLARRRPSRNKPTGPTL